MRIIGFIKTSLLDWDGHVTAVVYLPGCNFRCPFCHNKEIVLSPGSMDEVPFEEIENYVRSNSEFLDGVVVTGGEPTIHADLPDLLRRLKVLGTKVEARYQRDQPGHVGGYPRGRPGGLRGHGHQGPPLDEKYDDLAGVPVPVDRVKRSIEVLRTSGVEHEFRTTVVPILLVPGDVERIAAYIGGAQKYALQQFRPGDTLDPALGAVKPYSRGAVRGMAESAKQYVRKVVLRGDV